MAVRFLVYTGLTGPEGVAWSVTGKESDVTFDEE